MVGYQGTALVGMGLGLWSQLFVGFEMPLSLLLPIIFEHQLLCQTPGPRMAQTLQGCFRSKR